VPLDVGLCERCNPLGLKDSASSQAHGTVLVGIIAAVAALLLFARLSVSGIGPFVAQVSAVRAGSAAGSVLATVTVRNDGHTTGSATCRITDPADPALVHSLVLYTPRIDPGATATFEESVDFGAPDQPLEVSCQGPGGS
jgi:hypothetical protein